MPKSIITSLAKKKHSTTILLKLQGTTCNMACFYCYENSLKNTYNTQQYCTLDEVKEYLSNFIEYDYIFIVFHGGEPLLSNIEDISKLLLYIKSSFQGSYYIQFQTNGTLLTNEWLSLFQLYQPQISLSISLDPIGNKDLRRALNFDYRDIVLENLQSATKVIDNIGVVSVAHTYNHKFFQDFLSELVNINVQNLTINKYQKNSQKKDSISISELEYTDCLISIFKYWISRKYYNKINIQPLSSLFSKKENKLCLYLANPNKCAYFKTFYNLTHNTDFCDHITINKIPKVPSMCLDCNIYEKCGGGCLMENKDDSYCQGRKKLFTFIESIIEE